MRRFLFLLLALMPTVAFAQYGRTSVELTPFGGYRWGGTIAADQTDVFSQDVNVDDSGSYGLMLNVPVGAGFQLELMADRQSSALRTDNGLFGGNDRIGDIDVTYYHAGMLWEFNDRYTRPFFVISAGTTHLDPQVSGLSSENRFSGSIGGGVKVPLSNNIGLRIEGRGFWTSIDRTHDHCDYCDYNADNDFYQGEARIGLVIGF